MKFEKRSPMPVSAGELFEWHGHPGAFGRLAPPWQTLEVLREDPGLGVGKRVELKLGTPIGKRLWKARHSQCEEGRSFTDVQEKGPFKVWTHRHAFEVTGDASCDLVDAIEYELPWGGLGESFVRRQLEKSFAYRHWVTRRDLDLRNALPDFRKLKVAITGGSGFLGTQLKYLLGAQGHEVFVVTRSKRSQGDIRWNPAKGEVELERLEGLDAVVHLAGENLTSGRWNEARKKRLWSSRVDTTRFLVEALERLDSPPKVLLSGSGIGIYGSDADAEFSENAPRGSGFLAELCEAWEAEAMRAESLDTRVCLLRTGVVIDPRGGALEKMLPAFKLGLGGPLGSGKQWFPWISLEDWIGAVNWLLFSKRAKGAVNLVSPQMVRQKDFARALGKALGRPAILPAPEFALKAALGEMAEEALLASIRAKPNALEASGYPFALPSLEALFSRAL
ncbi:TIGR01777 family oxidoreductase [Pelagicoccus sp. SDUM812005]|uniref:TIGR01777 family oxidoreductase n=1 Tax=Pelagicoccus sp. SDUM812005 TaxID=3041257 RepID=UPI00280D1813|nr:TIGR01777 family oxidoreductase [Pelagicoccus sp. SDUM812005]MDQ8179834.1 TIGR01777 family oxidoreductase [Pelagicoccus sp. SDUM812005]